MRTNDHRRTTEQMAAEWGVSRLSISRWIKEFGRDVVEDDAELAGRLMNKPKMQERILIRCREILGVLPSEPVDQADQVPVGLIPINDLPEAAKVTAQQLSREEHRMRTGADAKTRNEARKAFRELTATLVSVRRAQAMIGQDSGEMLAKSEAKRMAHAWATRAALGAQRIRDHYAPKLINLQDETSVVAVLDDALITQMMLAPFARAIEVKAGTNLPAWFVEEIQRAMGDLISNGESELRKEADGHRVA